MGPLWVKEVVKYGLVNFHTIKYSLFLQSNPREIITIVPTVKWKFFILHILNATVIMSVVYSTIM